MKAVIMPKLGLTMEEGTVVRWLKRTGDEVKKGEVLVEIETDKAVNEVEATDSGTLGKVLVGEGDTAQVLQVIGYILEPGEDVPDEWPLLEIAESPPLSREGAPTAVKESQRAASRPRRPGKASPRAKRLAKEHGISLDEVRGSGPGGRVLEQDVIDFIGTQDVILPSRLQRITAERMSQSFTTAPHFYLRVEADASRLAEWREQLLSVIERTSDARLSFTDMLVLLVARTLRDHPRVNASWQDGRIRVFKEVNIGLAMAADAGLVVPVLKCVGQMTLGEIAHERERLARRVAAGKLSLEDLEGGTFTLSNLGMFGIDEFSAIINPPQSAILAVGRIAERPVVEDGHIEIKPTVWLVLSADHRVLDGVDGARFLGDLRRAIEAPDDIFEASAASVRLHSRS
jgi:pyruvate dehydrogenase E2 component (dihydrolipoamide acetyltransferase)